MRLAAVLLLICIIPFTACARQEASVVIAGSTSVQPYAEILAEEYAVMYPDRVIDIQGGGSSAGIMAVGSGAAQIGMSSRSLKEEERHLWSVEIARDGLAIIINPANPVVSLSLEQIRYAYTAEITNWRELGGPDAAIHIITREEGSGTRSAFEELVMGDARITPRAIVQDSNGAIRQLVADDPNSIGFISLGLVNTGDKPVKALQLDGVIAARENVINGSYPLFRPFLFISINEPSGHAGEFVEFILSPEGQSILSDEGLIPG